MPDANGRFLGISTQGLSNPYLDRVESRKHDKAQHAHEQRRRLTAMAMGRAVADFPELHQHYPDLPETFAP